MPSISPVDNCVHQPCDLPIDPIKFLARCAPLRSSAAPLPIDLSNEFARELVEQIGSMSRVFKPSRIAFSTSRPRTVRLLVQVPLSRTPAQAKRFTPDFVKLAPQTPHFIKPDSEKRGRCD